MAEAADPLVLGLLLAALVDSADLYFRMIRRRGERRGIALTSTRPAGRQLKILCVGTLQSRSGVTSVPKPTYARKPRTVS